MALSIEVNGQQQYDTVMADLADMTRPGAGLLTQLQEKLTSLQAVQLASAVIIFHKGGRHAGKPCAHISAVLLLVILKRFWSHSWSSLWGLRRSLSSADAEAWCMLQTVCTVHAVR